jgi:predicted 2-oxoglutarate/Fe(II)-dependent dioxygenase YbiX
VARVQPAALLASGLLERGLEVLEAAGGSSPADAATLRRQLLLARQSGALERAEAAARALARLDPGNEEAAYVAAMLAGGPARRTRSEWPANFVRIPNYLPRARYEELLSRLTPAAGVMTESVVYRQGAHLVAHETRRSTSTMELDPIAAEFGRGILARLTDWCDRLQMPVFEGDIRALKLTRYAEGDYFRPHRDDPTGVERPLGFVYYLRFPGQTFEGGELVVYDGPDDPSHGAGMWTTVRPEANSLVVMPSTHWHEVTPVRGGAADPCSGRFTLNGWLFRAGDGAPVPPSAPAR